MNTKKHFINMKTKFKYKNKKKSSLSREGNEIHWGVFDAIGINKNGCRIDIR